MYALTTSTTPAQAPAVLSMAAALAPRATGDVPAGFERLGTTSKIARNRTIYFEGDDTVHCFRVVSGTVRLCKVTEDGRRQIAAFLTAGELFGWTDHEAYSFSAEAVTDVAVEKYARARIDEAVKANPALGRSVLALLSCQLASAHEHLLLLGRMTAAERIAHFLLDLTKRQGGAARNVELAMNRKDLADYLGLTVETVSRVMNGLKRKGIIDFAMPEYVEVRQSAMLERLAMAA
jgi:CRP/FNR family nitrogen fixation transcriptional regulator